MEPWKFCSRFLYICQQNKSALKKVYAIAFILIMFSNQFGYYLLIHHDQQQWKLKMKHELLRQLKDEELTVISLTDNYDSIYWEDEGDEFSLDGKMYDVVRRAMSNGKENLYCIEDKKEKELLQRYIPLTKQTTGKHGKAERVNPVTLFINEVPENNNITCAISIPCYIGFKTSLFPGVTNLTTPPPRA